MAQPAISRHIKQLEEEVGSPLFLRYKKKVRLTEAGKNLLHQVGPILSEFDRIFSDFKEERAKVEGVLRIGSVPEAGKYLFLDHLIKFQKNFPGIEFKIVLSSTDQLIETLVDGKMDFALVSRSNFAPSLNVLPLFQDYPVLVGKDDRKKMDLEKDLIPLISYREDDYYTLEFIEKHFNKNQKKNFKIIGSINSHDSMLNWVLELDAFAVVPFSSLNQFQFKSKLKIYKHSNKQMTLDLVYMKNSTSELKKRTFLEAMKKINSF